MGKGGYKGGEEGFSVYVSNLAWEVAWQDLKDQFRQCGDVSRAEIMMDDNLRSKGCGVVMFRTEEAAKKAIAELNDTELKGRVMHVREDRNPERTQQDIMMGMSWKGKGGKGMWGAPMAYDWGWQGGGKGYGKGKGKGAWGFTRVFVANLDYEVGWQDVKDFFRQCGPVGRVELMMNEETKKSRGCGTVEFQTASAAWNAVQCHDYMFRGRPILVRPDTDNASGDQAAVRGGPASSGDPRCRVFVGNLSWSVQWQDLKDAMSEVGTIVRADVFTEGGVEGGRSKGCGLVEYQTYGAARRAVERLHDVNLKGRKMSVHLDTKPVAW
mmetsp:Transcript_25734/g.56731  ORF Transcript_25734/g.56731 Transcript_25734/m.56731 type:complete len:325 (-) Transcript_25734:42-1016(-)|eukprot:CAMPEP_0204273194 /NCGR_PEP_ID=MMETSP0468-20130131/22790_1 /ASSEMBLY_ACC=CAM_ASM_000383 /TAXON_ID=2969 /ORGANISM="Oxyrrhis marina" /LENGTH=324 /DNA_ID=CAMNT_0051249169 /DNA_START=43 /DNA_END=1017 /DNA_ORIENTATION=-